MGAIAAMARSYRSTSLAWRYPQPVTASLRTFASATGTSSEAAQTSQHERPRIVQPLISCLTKDVPWPPPTPAGATPWA